MCKKYNLIRPEITIYSENPKQFIFELLDALLCLTTFEGTNGRNVKTLYTDATNIGSLAWYVSNKARDMFLQEVANDNTCIISFEIDEEFFNESIKPSLLSALKAFDSNRPEIESVIFYFLSNSKIIEGCLDIKAVA